MAVTILADSGAIVAALDKRDEHPDWAAERLAKLPAPLVTCESVLSESFFLLQYLKFGKDALCALLERGAIVIRLDAAVELAPLLGLIRKYSDVPMSFADACLVRMSELHRDCVVFTTDSDFRTYRRHRRQAIPLIAP
jgi:predicted nucleic acid-binding protein